MDEKLNRKSNRRSFLIPLAAVLVIGAFAAAFLFFMRGSSPRALESPGEAPASAARASSTPAKEAVVSPEARQLLDQMRDAYRALKTAEFTGSVISRVEADGQQQNTETKFTSSFQEPYTFRHEAQDDLTAGSTGEKVFVFNKEASEYLLVDAPKSGGVQQMPEMIPGLLQAQNPSLLFALLDDPTSEFARGFSNIKRGPDIELDAKMHPAIVMEPDEKDGDLTFLLDPETHLLRQLRVDLRPALEQRGLEEIKVAEAIVDYTATKIGSEFAPNHFAWTPPEGAKDVSASRGPEETGAQTLVGKPAPDFQLTTLDGKNVALADLKGQVVVLDFWTTWCAPCIESMPHLAKLHADKRDAGVKIFAVNVQEAKPKVEGFLKARKIDVPVLLDADGGVAEKFNVISYPETIVIGKDGVVKKVFIGWAQDGLESLRAEVQRLQDAG